MRSSLSIQGVLSKYSQAQNTTLPLTSPIMREKAQKSNFPDYTQDTVKIQCDATQILNYVMLV